MPRLLSLRELLRHAFAIAPGRRRTKNARNPLRRCLQLEALEDRLVPAGDILVTGSLPNVGNVFQEYTSIGSLIRTVPVPPPPNDSFTYVESIAQDANGNVYVWDGRSTLALAVYNAQSGNWSQLTYPQGWSTAYQSGQTGVAVYGHYAYVSNETGPSGQPTDGVIRFDLDTGIGTEFNPFGSGTVSVAMGLDGNLYALGYNKFYELDPNTMALENTVNLPNESYVGLAVDAAGDIYMASSDGTIDSFDPTGTQIATTTLAGNPASIAIASNGTLAVGTRYDGVVRMTTAFTNVTTSNVADGGDNVAFAQVAPPGPASPSQSVVSCTATTLQSGTMTATVTLTAMDANGLRVNGGGLDVQFGLAAGAAQGSFTTVTDNADGSYTATLTGLAPGATTVTATINGQAVTSTLPSLTITPSAAAGNILMTAHPQFGSDVFEELTHAGTVIRSVPIPSDLGGAGNLAADPDGNVYISHGTISIGDVADYNAATGTWSALTSNSIGAFDGGVAVDGNFVYTGTNEGGAAGIIRWDLATGVGTDFDSSDGGFGAITLGLDGYLYALSGQTVDKFDPGTMNLISSIQLPYLYYYGLAVNASGDVFTTTYSSNIYEFNPAGVQINEGQAPADAGAITQISIGPDGTLLMTGGGNVVRMTAAFTVVSDFPESGIDGVAFVPSLSLSTVSVTPSNIASGSVATVTLQAVDANGDNLVAGGAAVYFALGSGNATGDFGPVTDNHNGTYTASFTGVLVGSSTITATINGQAVTSTPPTITVTPGPVSLSLSTLTVAAANMPVLGATTVTLQAKDANGNNETSGGLTVTMTCVGAAGNSLGGVTDNSNGTYTATFTAGTSVGVNTISADIGGQPITSTHPTITVSPGPVSLAQSTVKIAASILAGAATTLTLQAEDAYGNNETSGGLAVAFALGSGAGSGIFGSVNDHGNGTYTAVFTGTTIGANTITATIDTQAVTSPAPSITVTPGPLSPSLSTISIAPNTIPAGTPATITLTLLDAGSNPFIGSPSIVVALTGAVGGSFSGATSIGNGVYTATFTDSAAGAGTIGATINGIALTSALPSVAVTPLALDHFNVAAGNGLVTITAQDVYNNTASSFTGSVHLASVNNKSVPINYTYSPGADAGHHQFNLATATGVDVTNLSNFAGATPANVAVQAQINLTVGQYAGLVTRYSGPTDKSFYFGGIIPSPSGHGFVAAIWVNKTGTLTGLTALVPMTSVQGTLYFETAATILAADEHRHADPAHGRQ